MGSRGYTVDLGSVAPDFALSSQSGDLVHLKDFLVEGL